MYQDRTKQCDSFPRDLSEEKWFQIATEGNAVIFNKTHNQPPFETEIGNVEQCSPEVGFLMPTGISVELGVKSFH